MNNEINIKLEEIISNISKKGNDIVLNSNTDLVDDLGLDSLALVQLIIAVEDEFAISFVGENFDYKDMKSYSCLLCKINELVERRQ